MHKLMAEVTICSQHLTYKASIATYRRCVCEDLQVLDVLALLNVMKLFTFPTVQGTEKEKADKARNCRGQITQNADSLRQTMVVRGWVL